MGSGARRALWVAASVVVFVGATACGAPSHPTRAALWPPPPPVAATVEPAPQPVAVAPAALAVETAAARPPTARLVATRTQPAVKPKPADDALFQIEIPRLGLSAKVHEGQSLDVLARGPGHLQGSALPGEPGNVVIPGHRTVSPHPFLDIDRLQNGDEIVLVAGSARFVYVVTGTAIVSPDDLAITDPTPDATVTLYACHPKGSDRQRYVVFGRLQTAPSPPKPAPPPPPPGDAAPPPSCGLIPCVHR